MGALVFAAIVLLCICAVVDYPKIKEREEWEAKNQTNLEVQKKVYDSVNKDLDKYLDAPLPPRVSKPVSLFFPHLRGV